jgi:hypothetical protein
LVPVVFKALKIALFIFFKQFVEATFNGYVSRNNAAKNVAKSECMFASKDSLNMYHSSMRGFLSQSRKGWVEKEELHEKHRSIIKDVTENFSQQTKSLSSDLSELMHAFKTQLQSVGNY